MSAVIDITSAIVDQVESSSGGMCGKIYYWQSGCDGSRATIR